MPLETPLGSIGGHGSVAHDHGSRMHALPRNVRFIEDLRVRPIPQNLLAPDGFNVALLAKREQYLKQGVCLDIGPKDSPYFPMNHTSARFLDVQTRGELIERYARTGTHLREHRVPEINYVWNGSLSYAELTNGQLFHYVHASHVLEHVPDPISWFADVCEVLHPNGKLHLVVPDARFDFDFRRRPSGVADVVASFLERRVTPSIASTYDNFVRMRPKHNAARKLWKRYPNDYRLTHELHAAAFRQAQAASRGHPDFGVHSWQWQPETFVHQMLLFCKVGLIKLRIVNSSVVKTPRNKNAFTLLMMRDNSTHGCRPTM